MTTLERPDLRLARTSLQYAIDYGWTTEVRGARLVFGSSTHVVGIAVPSADFSPLVTHLSAHRLSYPVLRLPERPADLVFLATTHTLAAAPWPLVDVALPPSHTESGPVTWVVPPRRSPNPVPALTTLLAAMRSQSGR
ncbi:hypothetical protein Lesp02_05370 [Lentzea sp. NBRC 105346]|uniref:hypothetical protein n=1 Tax=Lentzea sp. NBRC 105346 TaxID=3032205 RepID=UPI0024A54D50|nr:hypothetical protein [Lentzea sp. NBRC 105346]GLZ28347.1 hypothetical protein Lesp02_05370 [Lentzea sp. NBRC 105346]